MSLKAPTLTGGSPGHEYHVSSCMLSHNSLQSQERNCSFYVIPHAKLVGFVLLTFLLGNQSPNVNQVSPWCEGGPYGQIVFQWYCS